MSDFIRTARQVPLQDWVGGAIIVFFIIFLLTL